MSASIFGVSGSHHRTPVPTTRDFQERVVKLAQEERARCSSAQPVRSRSSFALMATRSNAFPTPSRAAGPEIQLTDKVGACGNRVSTPELKNLIVTDASGLASNPVAAAHALNGPPSPSRTRVRRSVAEVAAETIRSRGNSPNKDCSEGPSPIAAAGATALSSSFDRPLSAALRPSSASPAVLHTVGPREFARLKVRMRTESPWALHVGDDTSAYAAIEEARKAQQRAAQALWVQSLQDAVDQRKRIEQNQKAIEREAELQFLARAQAMTQHHSTQRMQVQHERVSDRQHDYQAYLSIREHEQQAQRDAAQQDRFVAVESAKKEANKRLSEELERRSKQKAVADYAMAMAQSRKESAEKQRIQYMAEEMGEKQQHHEDLDRRKQEMDDALNERKQLIEKRALVVASKMKPSKKQRQQDRIESEIEKTSMQLLATNIRLNETLRETAKRRAEDANRERCKTVLEREEKKRTERSRKIMEEEELLRQDREAKRLYDQTYSELKAQQQETVRQQLELQRVMAMRKVLNEISQE